MATPPDHIEIIARALITRPGSILLCKDLKKGYFYLPGGHVDHGESASEACKRELQEELALCAHIGSCRLITEQRFEQGGKPRHEINLVFHVEHLADPTCQPPNPSPISSHPADQAHTGAPAITSMPGDPKIQSTESHIGFEWVEISNLKDTDLRPADIRDWLLNHDGTNELRFLAG